MTHVAILGASEKRQFDGPPLFKQADRHRYFTVSSILRSTLSSIKQPANRVGFVLQYGYFRASARFYPSDQFRQRDVDFVSQLLRIQAGSLTRYSGTVVSRHRQRILNLLDWQTPDTSDIEQLYQQALRHAQHQDPPKDIFYSLVDACWKQQFVIPSYHDLSEIITRSYNAAEKTLLAVVDETLTSQQKRRLEKLLEPTGRRSRATLAITGVVSGRGQDSTFSEADLYTTSGEITH